MNTGIALAAGVENWTQNRRWGGTYGAPHFVKAWMGSGNGNLRTLSRSKNHPTKIKPSRIRRHRVKDQLSKTIRETLGAGVESRTI